MRGGEYIPHISKNQPAYVRLWENAEIIIVLRTKSQAKASKIINAWTDGAKQIEIAELCKKIGIKT